MSDTLAGAQNTHPNRFLSQKIRPWIDEQIWGHRLWDSQSPWLVFLEFLTVAEGCWKDGHLLDPARSRFPLHFEPAQRLYLRNVLFNNEPLVRIAEKTAHSAAAWNEWLEWMNENAQGLPAGRDFSYLRDRFSTYHEFARLIVMLRRSMVESQSNRRWSSQFVFPFGRHALYEDLAVDVRTGRSERQYINFGRTGELLYLMLARSCANTRLAEHLSRYLESESPWNRLLGLLQPSHEEKRPTRGESYLPYEQHPAFDRLGDDWLAILELPLPSFDAFPHLVALAGLHVLLYQLDVAAASAGAARPHMICEVVAPKKTLVRELSSSSYLSNNALSAQAVERYVEEIGASPAWQAALSDPVPFDRCREILQEEACWGDEYSGANDPGEMLGELRSVALRGHRQHAGNVHRTYGREAGLVSKRGTNKLRYAPTDAFLKTILFANVPRRMEFGEFLTVMFERYGLVFGEREAERVLSKDDHDKKAFQSNARRLEQRLASLGLLRRLSDGCAYVENPLVGAAR
jgi:hypothetical protein